MTTIKDSLDTIHRSARHFFSGTLLSRISGMLRDISMAYSFGTHSSVAAFMVAFRFAHLLRRLFGEGALQSAFIPEFEALRQNNEARAFAFFNNLSATLTLFLFLLCSISGAMIAAFLTWGNLSPKYQEILYLTLLMLPSLLFICLFGLNSSLLQCEKRYFIPSAAPVAFNGVWIIAALSLQHIPTHEAMPWLACGVVIACFSQWLLTIPKMRESFKNHSKVLSSSIFSSDLKRMLKPLSLGLLGVGATQINNAVDSLFAYFAEPEGPALLWYAMRIQQLPLALFGIAIAGAVLPPLSRALKDQRQDDYHNFLQEAIYRTWSFMLPLTALIFLMGDLFVILLYGRGEFGVHSSIGTTHCLIAYTMGLLPAALVLILAPAYYAQSNYLLPTIASILSMISNALLNLLFIFGLGWGAVSVAYATSISAWINLLFLGYALLRKNARLIPLPLFSKGAALALMTLVAYGGGYIGRDWMSHLFLFSPLQSMSDCLLMLCCISATFGAIFILGFASLKHFSLKHPKNVSQQS